VLLSFLRYRFIWWPVHPLGLAVANSWMVRHAAVSIAVAWLCKLIIIKTGGMVLYRRTVPFFIGLIVGYALAVPVGYLLDVIYFPGQGHAVHAY
jgi:xanthine/uracil permease